MRFGKRRAAACLALAVFGLLGTSASASADTGTDGFTILHAKSGQVAHKCTVIGSDNEDHQAVVCVDIETVWFSDGSGYEAYGQVEAYCQEGSGSATIPIQCAEVDLDGTWADAGGDRRSLGIHCGHSYGPCSVSGRNYDRIDDSNADDYTTGSECSSQPNSYYDVWTVAIGGTSTQDTTSETRIELPFTDKWTYLGTGNTNDGTGESTGHYYVCP
jgi:hypothetical protein